MPSVFVSLAPTALLMGLVGGPHCVAMCGAACAGLGAGAGSGTRAVLAFQGGRIAGYAGAGALAAASMQGLGWLTVQSAALRPLWTFLHVGAMALGLVLLWRAQQPLWLEGLGRWLWKGAQRLGLRSGAAPWLIGILWALLPCGLLYSALMVAALAGNIAGGAALMALFALGTSLSMVAGPWLWLRVAGRKAPGVVQFVGPPGRAPGDWGVRLAGLALCASAAWALWMGLVHNTAPWCVPGA